MDDSVRCVVTGVAGVGLCAVGGLGLYHYNKTKLKFPEFEAVNEGLIAKVKCQGVLPYVAITGCVAANHKTIRGSGWTDAPGVMKRTETKHHLFKWNYSKHKWVNAEETSSISWNMESFNLTSKNSKVSVTVKNPELAYSSNTTNTIPNSITNKLHLSKSENEYKSTGKTQADAKLFGNVVIRGIETIEELLLLGSGITVAGEVKLDADGRLIISPPFYKNLKYFITTDSYDALTYHLDVSQSRTQMYVASLFLVMGIGFLMFCCYKKYLEYKSDNGNGNDNVNINIHDF